MKSTSTLLSLTLIIIHAVVSSIHAQPAFTYQGRLQNVGTNVSGLYDFQFALYPGASGGAQFGPINTRNSIPTSNGLFTVTLDFGTGAFDGTGRWLEIGVKPAGASGSHTLLTPRQPVTPAPEAIFAQAAATVAASSVTSTQLAPAAVTGMKIANGQIVRSINFLTDNIGIVPGEGLTLNTVGNTLQLGLGPANCVRYSDCYWNLLGNGNITPGVNFLGTVAGESDPLEFRVNNVTAMRYEPSSSTPNIIGGFSGNSVAAGVIGASIGGGGETGRPNTITSDFATIGGGRGNKVVSLSPNSTIGGGNNNAIDDLFFYSGPHESCTIGGGSSNSVSGDYNTICGGHDNHTTVASIYGPAAYTTISGGSANRMAGAYYSSIGGGRGNYIGATGYAFIGGGDGNRINSLGRSDTIGGGEGNTIAADIGRGNVIAGGASNYTGRGVSYCTISGGRGNSLGSFYAHITIGGGEQNAVSADWGTVSGGQSNRIQHGGWHATIPGGFANFASRAAFAAGTRAKASDQGAFVWGDSTDADIASTNENSVTMRASGGYRLFSDPAATVGADLASGSGSWTIMSDRNAKENFEDVTPREVLKKVVALPVQRWNYKTQEPTVRHIGPTAQDFKAAFNLGESDTGISTVDANGVALAAIQGLNQRIEEKDAEIRELRSALKQIQTQLSDLRERAKN